jgi:hypothetical protein
MGAAVVSGSSRQAWPVSLVGVDRGPARRHGIVSDSAPASKRESVHDHVGFGCLKAMAVEFQKRRESRIGE